jgi:hypothetical protein
MPTQAYQLSIDKGPDAKANKPTTTKVIKEMEMEEKAENSPTEEGKGKRGTWWW